MKELYVQVPHRIQDYLMTAKLNMTQFRIFNAVVRYTYGFHEEWRQLSFSFLSEVTRCNERQIKRELKTMLERGILVERMHDGKRELRINPLLGGDSLDTGRGDSLDTTASDSLDTHIKKDSKETYKENKRYIDFDEIDAASYLQIYHSYYKRKFNKQHPRVTEEQAQRIIAYIDQLNEWDVDEETFEEAVAEHFDKLPISNDGKIFPFIEAAHRYFIGERD